MNSLKKQVLFYVLGFCIVGLPVMALAESVFVGTTDNSWNEATNWDPQGVPTTSDDVSIPAGKSVVATGDIVCRNLSLAGNLTLGDSSTSYATARPNVSLAASGDITLSDAATLTVYAGRLADLSVMTGTEAALQAALYAHANVVSAAGAITFGAGTTVKPNNDPVSGTPVIFRAKGNITVAAGATVDANRAGWATFNATSPSPAATSMGNGWWTYGRGYGSGSATGGGYGGKGGGGTRTYGVAYAPLMPGSSGGVSLGVANITIGGGTICLQAEGALSVRGTLTAVGNRGGEYSGGSGGGIWLCGDTVDYAAAEKICADGEGIPNNVNAGAGGAGRVAICEGLTSAELTDMAGETARGETPVALSIANVTAKGGVNANNTSRNGADGTVVYVLSSSRCAHVSIVTPGVPELKMAGLSYEERVLSLGETSVDVPEYAYLATDPTNVRYSYDGYVVSNATQEVCAGGASERHIVFTLVGNEGPYKVYLKWTNREARHGYGSVPAAYGTFTLNGEDVGSSFAVWGAEGVPVTSVIGFVPASGCTFLGWSGSYPRAHALGNPATCTSTSVFGLTPRVSGCTATGESISWNGGTGSWDDAANWSGGKVPTLLDDVTIASGAVTVSETFAAKSLTLTGGTLTVGETNGKLHFFGTVAGDVVLSGSAALKVKAARPQTINKTSQQTFQTSLYDQAESIRIGGALTIGAGATVEIANDPLTGLPVVFRTGSLTVAAGGTLTADAGGFGWVLKTDEAIFDNAYTGNFAGGSVIYATHGYGRANCPSYYGAGYGGRAGTPGYDTPKGAGNAYGFETAPLFPGSPCGLYNADKFSYGGGTVCVFADGAVSVNGTVSSRGVHPGIQQGGSSGGAIWLAGAIVQVDVNALVAADGNPAPNGNAGAGGGGRVLFSVGATAATLDALVDGATPESQGLTTTRIGANRVTVAGGINPGGSAKNAQDGTTAQVYNGVSHVVTVAGGSFGTVAVNGSGAISGASYRIPSGASETLTAVPTASGEFICWRGDVPLAQRQSPSIVVSSETAAHIQAVFSEKTAEPMTYHWKANAVGDWYDDAKWQEGRIPGSADNAVLASGQIAADTLLHVGSLTVSNGAALTVRDCREIVVERDLTLTSANTSMRIVSLPTDETYTWTNGAARVRVAGTLAVTNSATLYPESDMCSGGSPVFFCGCFVLGEDATVNAASLGFGATEAQDSRPVNLCPGGSGYMVQVGGGYGGLGGTKTSDYNAGFTYGLALSPIHPGAPNGLNGNLLSNLIRGGGLVRIHAGEMTVNGTINVGTIDPTYPQGGASGGGIWLTCEKMDALSFGSTAQLLAKGGRSLYQGVNYTSHGGGGRIAVCGNYSEALGQRMIDRGAYPGPAKKHVFDRETFLARFPGVTIDVRPGSDWSDDPQYSGTFTFVDGTTPGLMLMVR